MDWLYSNSLPCLLLLEKEGHQASVPDGEAIAIAQEKEYTQFEVAAILYYCSERKKASESLHKL